MHEVEQGLAHAATAMTDDELETAIAALHGRERAFLVAVLGWTGEIQRGH